MKEKQVVPLHRALDKPATVRCHKCNAEVAVSGASARSAVSSPDTFKGLGFRGMDGAGTAVEERQHAESDALISPRVRDVGLAMIGGMDVPEAGVAIAMERMRSKLRWVEGLATEVMATACV